MKVYLNDPIAATAVERLKKHVDLIDNYDHPEELDAVIVRQQHCPGDFIRRAVRCRLIQQHGAGLDRIDTEAAKQAGIPVRNTPGTNARSVAEYTIAMMLDLSRKVSRIDRKTRAGELTAFGMSETVGIEMSGKKLGLIGSGHVSCEVAQIARDGFHMEIYCFSLHKTPGQIEALGMIPVPDLKTLFRNCDYVSLHCLLSEESYHLINADILREANPDLILINTARGGLIDEAALFEALRDRKITAAGLDVFEQQPPSVDNPLFTLENFLAGMHVAGSTHEALERTGKAVVDSVFSALEIDG